MKNKAKRIVSAVCALAMCAALAPAAAFAEGNQPNDSGISTQSVAGWRRSVSATVGETVTVRGGVNWTGLTHSWEILRGDNVVSITSGEDTAEVTVTANAEGVAVLCHTYWDTFWGIPYKSYEYVKVCVKPADPTDPEPSEGEGLYFYVALPSNTTMVDDVTPYRYLTYGGKVAKNAPQDQTLRGDAALTYVDNYPESGALPGESPAYNTAPTSDPVQEGSSWTIDPATGDVTDFDFVIDDKHYTDEEWNFSWEKFSYAYTTDVVGSAYHLDGMLYKIITLEDVLEDVNPEKIASGFIYDEDGKQDYDHTFDFVLTRQDDETFKPVQLQATTSDVTPADITEKNPDDGKLELEPGTYEISELLDDAGKQAWSVEDTIVFEVNRDGSVEIVSGDASITNFPVIYTVTYDANAGEDEVTNLPVDVNSYRYNELAAILETVPSREGYDFQGWSLTPDGELVTEDTLQITGNVTLYALWAEKTVDPDPDDPAIQPAGHVDLNKTAAALVNDQTDVTLSIGATEEEKAAYVVFVLDKSTSADVREEAGDMLDELLQQVDAGYSVNVSVLSFESAVDEIQDWTELSADTLSEIKESLNEKRSESGTNIYLGLREGKEKLDELTDVDGAHKHLVLVTDGITYLWSGENDSNLYSIYSESASNGEESINSGNDMMALHHIGDYDQFVGEFSNMKDWMDKYGQKIAADIELYQHLYEKGQYRADQPGQMTDSTYLKAGFDEGDYIPYESLADHFSANEAAVYMAATEWMEIVDAGYNAYAYADTTGSNLNNAKSYPWASNFISSLGTLGGASAMVSDDTIDGMFDNVKSSIIYAIQSGTVTDVIGDDFDLSSVNTFTLTVGGEEIKGTVNGNTVDFGNYTVTYYPEGTENEAREHFVWEINTPVENAAPAELTYTLKLVNKAAEPGDYTVPTNEKAVLEYTSSNGGSGSEEFPVPKVTYNVPETSTTVTTPKPDEHPDIAEGIANGTWGGKPTATPAPSSTIPQTGDELAVGALVVVAIVAAGAAGGLIVLRKRREQ